MSFPKVIISLLNWQHYQNTIKCITSLQTIDYDNFEIIIIDNNSPNDSFEQIKNAYPELRALKSNTNGGYAAGHKIVADIAIKEKTELLWILNNDLTVRKDTLTELVNAYKEYGSAIYGSTTLLRENPDIINFGGGEEYKDMNQAFSYNIYYGSAYSVEFKNQKIRNIQSVEGCSMLIPVPLIKRYGFMDTRYFMYGEETDYCFYCRKKEIPSLLVTTSVVLHKGGGSFVANNKMSVVEAYYRRRNYILLCKKYFGMNNFVAFKLSGGILSLIKFFIKYLFSTRSHKTSNKTDFYINLATIHAVFGLRGKRIKPEKLSQC